MHRHNRQNCQTLHPPPQETRNHAFGKPCVCPCDTRHFRHFHRFHGVWAAKPLFYWLECYFVIFAVFFKTPSFSGTKVCWLCTGDFAPPEPEFRAEFWETNFGRPNVGPEFLGRFFWLCFFISKWGPLKNSPLRNSPPKINLPKFNPEIGPKNSHCTSAGPFGWLFLAGDKGMVYQKHRFLDPDPPGLHPFP